MAKAPFEAGLIVPVPEAEPLVGDYRRRFDPVTGLGVPAHITLNYPFKPHVLRPDAARAELTALLPSFAQFVFRLTEIRTFPGVVYLAPEPNEPFLELIGSIVARFPDAPPYNGEHAETIPHLTVAQVEEAAVAAIKADFHAHAAPALPLQARAREIWLMDNAEVRWKTRAVFPLRRAT